MKIDILDIDKLVDVNNLKEVTSSHLFSTKMTFDDNGLLSNSIFGISRSDRLSTYAYIDLRKHFIHPHIYANVMKNGIFRDIIYLISGQKKFSIQDNFIVRDSTSPNAWTGLDELYDHWDEIDWNQKKSQNLINKDILMKLTKKQVFIDKLLVCPPSYRDVMLSGTVDSSDYVNELNNLYTAVIRNVALLSQGGIFARKQFATQSKIQSLLVDIFSYFSGLLAKKQGLIRRSLMGKTTDWGVRSVIAAPLYNHDKISDSMVSLTESAIPIAQCASTFHPFIRAYIKNFFTNNYINTSQTIPYIVKETGEIASGTVVDPDLQFSDKNINKMINNFILNPDSRFDPIIIKIQLNSSKKNKEVVDVYTYFKGKEILPNNVYKELNRPLTVVDIMYLACYHTCKNRHVMISRYPVGIDKGIFFTKINVATTQEHQHILYNGEEYKFYPKVYVQPNDAIRSAFPNMEETKLTNEDVAKFFIDTTKVASSHLRVMSGDNRIVVTVYSNVY